MSLARKALRGASGSLDPFSFAITDFVTSTTNGTTFTFTNRAIGADVSLPNVRYIVVAVTGAFAASVTGVTINGVAATAIVSKTSGNLLSYIFRGTATGTTATIVVSVADTCDGLGIAVASLVNPASSAAHDSNSADGTTSVTLDIDIPTGGAAIACAQFRGASTTWSGVTETYDFDAATGESSTAAFGGSAGTPASISASCAGSTDAVGASASWGP